MVEVREEVVNVKFDPKNPDPVRLAINRNFVKTFTPSICNEVLEKNLESFTNVLGEA